MSSSVTVTISSTSLLDVREGEVAGPADRDAVGDRARTTDSAHRRAGRAASAGYAAAPSACTPITRTSGRSALTATAIPEISPPPPTGRRSCCTSGHCSRISSADRALAGDRCRGGRTGGSTPRRSAPRTRCAATSASSTVRADSCTSAPYPLVAATLGIGAPTGMKTVAAMPSSRAASATPWAWLPALAATTPRARSSADEPGDPHVRAADLERPGALEVLALQPGGAAERRGERPARLQRGGPHDPGEHRAGPPECRRATPAGSRRPPRGRGYAPVPGPAGGVAAPRRGQLQLPGDGQQESARRPAAPTNWTLNGRPSGRTPTGTASAGSPATFHGAAYGA